MAKYSIVIPAYNEAENIVELVLKIKNVMENLALDYEIIVVDDASTDNTSHVLFNLRRQLTTLRIFRHKLNCGQSTALHTGIHYATGNVIVTIDGDGQNDPNDIPKMIDIFNQHKENNMRMVVGYRKNRKDNFVRKISSKIANTIRASVLKDNTPDTGCGLKVFNRKLFLSFPFFDHIHRFLPALAQRHGAEVISIEVNHLPRKHGVSQYGIMDRLWVGIVDLFGVLWLKKRMKIPVVEEMFKAESK